MDLSQLVSGVVGYVLLPVTIERPSVGSRANLSGATLAFLYAVDPPRNLFPSFHAAIAAILLRLSAHTQLASAVTAWLIAICAACLLTRQHYVLDVVAGLAVGAFAVAVVDAWRRRYAQTTTFMLCNAHSVQPETVE